MRSKVEIKLRKVRKVNNESKSWVYMGDEYVSKKSKVVGDVKKEGKLDLYVYWFFDFKILNRWEVKRNVVRKGMGSVMKLVKKM